MIRSVFRLTAVGVALVALGQDALACPPHAHHGMASPSLIPWNLMFLVALFLGVPAVLFRLMAPSPLRFEHDRKLWSLRIGSAILGGVLSLTMAFKDRKAFTRRVAEVVRQRIMFDGVNEAWRTWARSAPNLFHRVLNVANVGAMMAVVSMWTWTVVDDAVTWGVGGEIPISFTIDTVLTYVAARFMLTRVGMHLAAGMMEPDRWVKITRTLYRGMLLGGAGGWLGGALFGLSSGFQTYAMIPAATTDVIPFLTGAYGIHMMLMGSVLGSVLGAVLLWPGRPEPRGLLSE